ncbi:MAG: hypothetical protein QXS54_09375 [Candidatus Methanomethylicaceae archaeon]
MKRFLRSRLPVVLVVSILFLTGCSVINEQVSRLYKEIISGLIRFGAYVAVIGIVMAALSLLVDKVFLGEYRSSTLGRFLYIVVGIIVSLIIITQSSEIANFVGSFFDAGSFRVIKPPR